MHYRLVMTLAIATAATVPGFATATGMFCQPGEDWTTVDSGTITGEGWSVVNFTKPEGGEVRIVWDLEGFDDGPSSAGMILATEPMSPVTWARLYKAETEPGARIEVNESGLEGDRTASVEAVDTGAEGDLEIGLRILAHVDRNLTIFQYAAGDEGHDRALTWKVQTDSCLDPEDVETTIEDGEGAHLLGPEDLQGTLNLQATAPVPGTASNGAVAMLDTRASQSLAHTPFIDAYWANQAGDMHIDGPDGITEEDLFCSETSSDEWCTGWGTYLSPFSDNRKEGLVPGEYQVSVTGFTDPTSNPQGSTVGPYFTLVETRFPNPGGASQ